MRKRFLPLPSFRSLRALVFCAGVVAFCGAQTAQAQALHGGFYADAVEAVGVRAGKDAAIQLQLDKLLTEADRICTLPLVTRAYSLQALRDDKSGRLGKIDGRTNSVEAKDAEKAEIFALSMADTDTANIIFRELPLLAAAYRLTGKPQYRERIEAQLREVLTWTPLQRPGWTLFTADNDLPLSGDDGVWLSTGLGLVGLVQTLQILPDQALPQPLRADVAKQLEFEINRIVHDWEKRVPWYVRSNNVITNQWVVPSSGLVVAAAYLGRDAHADAYNLGVKNLQASLSALGEDGSSSEGTIYASHWTAPFLYLAARASQQAGDDTLSESAFLRHFPDWLAGSYQPGGHVINCFDGYNANRGTEVLQLADITLLAVMSRDPSLIWVLQHLFNTDMLALNLYGLLALSLPESLGHEPPLFGVYERAAWMVWRDSWQEDASGVWVRGGHALDFHDHNDRGHVNFIVDGKAVLIEAGTPGYELPEKATHYNSVRGHNVLQVDDELFPRKQPAPITVHRLDAKGGDVTVEAGAGYREGIGRWQDGAGRPGAGQGGTVQWQRNVVWDANTMIVTDRVRLQEPGRLTFRWHLGSAQPLTIERESATAASAFLPAGKIRFQGWNAHNNQTQVDGILWTPPQEDVVQTPQAVVSVQAGSPVRISQQMEQDHTFKFRITRHLHTTLVVQTEDAVLEFELQTRIESPGVFPASLLPEPAVANPDASGNAVPAGVNVQ